MKKILMVFLCSLSFLAMHAQSPDDLNKQANELLAKGDVKNGLVLLKRAAALGQAEAQYSLGGYYQEGYGVDKNDSIGSAWILLAAEQGWKPAQYKISYCYAGGKGVGKSLDKAFEWIEKCARQHDAECMFTVSECYKDGVGTTQNLDSMVAWYIRLGTLEKPVDFPTKEYVNNARIKLAFMYRDGNAVNRDRVHSYAWFLLYNENKKILALSDQQNNIAAIRNLEKLMGEPDQGKALEVATKLIGHPLSNVANLHKEEH